MQELPQVLKGDQRGEISIPADGQWTETVREAYADRIIDRLAEQMPNLKSSISGRRAYSPAYRSNHGCPKHHFDLRACAGGGGGV